MVKKEPRAMVEQFRVGELVSLPAPFDDVVGQVIRVFDTGTTIFVTVRYVLDGTDGEELTKGFLPEQLKHAAAA
jgi:hypothetical protein